LADRWRKAAAHGQRKHHGEPSGTFRTGAGLLNIAANKQEQFETLCRLIGREELVGDPRFRDREDRKRRRFELKAEIERALAARSAPQWSALLNKNGVPAGEVLDVPAVLDHPQVLERGLLKTFPSVPEVDRPIRVVRSGFRLGSGDPQPSSPPPVLGADTDDLLRELGFCKREIDELAREGAI
jgi:crotonobetainyl-CoA:carnitine CoA-transferase CaiB-like acyl-CoA transferase